MHKTRTRIACLSAVCAVPLVGGAAAAAPASAAEACPTRATAPVVRWESLDRWQQKKAVSLCRGFDANGARVMDVQIVDFAAGAKMRIMSQPIWPGSSYTNFSPLTAAYWASWMKSFVSTPSPDLLVSATNGAPAHPTHVGANGVGMAFPQKKWNAIASLGADSACHFLPGSLTSAKRYFGLSDPHGAGRQYPYIDTFDDPCQSSTSSVTRGFSTYRGQPVDLFDATVGFHPLYGDEASRQRRTFVGTRSTDGLWGGTQDVAYLLTSDQPLTIGEARGVLTADFHTMYNVRLDGDGATQYSAPGLFGHGIDSSDEPDREVPEALAVYDAP
jgi:hypothetical protein